VIINNAGSRRDVDFWTKHLQNQEENDRAELREIRGLSADNLQDALLEMQRDAEALPRLQNFMYHADFNPARHERLTDEQWDRAFEIFEKERGIPAGKPRVVFEHEKDGRVHRHLIWTRVDHENRRATPDGLDWKVAHTTARTIEKELGLENLRRHRQEDFLVYYAATRLQGLKLARFSVLPEETQADILSIWPSFKSAKDEGDAFLFSLGDPERVRASTASSSVGKLIADSLYAHRSLVDQLPPLSRLQIIGARQIVGDIDYDIVKLSTDGRKLSFLRYPHFDTDAHPSLAYSLAVYLPKTAYSYREFLHSDNPPILHRKDSLVDETHPLYQKFLSLTRQEEKRSLLSRPDIGQKMAWERVLAEAGFTVRGHRLLRRRRELTEDTAPHDCTADGS
jgi:hypothetical protein